MLWLLLLACISPALAQSLSGPTLINGLQAQRPPAARVNQTWTWALLTTTFETTANDALTYSASGLPHWAAFDATSLTFTGVPTSGDLGSTNVSVTAQSSKSYPATASDSFQLLVVDTPAPTIEFPVAEQLQNHTTLPEGCILHYDGSLRIPPTWSFSIGLEWNTVATASGNNAYYTAYLAGTTWLPDWLHFDPSTVTFDGIAPDPGGIYEIVLFASDYQYYGDVSQTFTLIVEAHSFDLVSPLAPLITSLGATVSYEVSTANLSIDHIPATPSNISYIVPDLDALPYLTFSNSTNTITGQLPASDAKVATTQIPILFGDSYGNTLTTLLNFTVVGATNATGLLSNQSIPALVVQPGQNFTDDLDPYAISPDSQYSVVLSPSAASQWLTFNATSMQLIGVAPVPAPSYGNVTVTLVAKDPASGGVQNSTFVVAVASSRLDDVRHTSGSASKLKVILAAVLGGLVILLLLLLGLFIYCRHRRRTGQKSIEDEGTLVGDMSPYPMKASPLPDRPPTPNAETSGFLATILRPKPKVSREHLDQSFASEKIEAPRRFGLLDALAPPKQNSGLGIDAGDETGFDVRMADDSATYRAPSRAESTPDSFFSEKTTSTDSVLYTPPKPSSAPRRWIPSNLYTPSRLFRRAGSAKSVASDVPSAQSIAIATRQKVDYGDGQLRDVVGRGEVKAEENGAHSRTKSHHLQHEDLRDDAHDKRTSVMSVPYTPSEGGRVLSAVIFPASPPPQSPKSPTPGSQNVPRPYVRPAPRPRTPDMSKHQRGASEQNDSQSSIKHEPQYVKCRVGGVLKFVPILMPKPIVVIGSPGRDAPTRAKYTPYVVAPDDEEERRQPLPKWLTFNGQTLEFWGMPKKGDVGELHIQVISRMPAERGSPRRRDTWESRTEADMERLVARVVVQVIPRNEEILRVVEY